MFVFRGQRTVVSVAGLRFAAVLNGGKSGMAEHSLR